MFRQRHRVAKEDVKKYLISVDMQLFVLSFNLIQKKKRKKKKNTNRVSATKNHIFYREFCRQRQNNAKEDVKKKEKKTSHKF